MNHNTLHAVTGGWAETPPTHCRNGHEFGPRRVLVGSYVCSCDIHHHRTHRCLTCDAVTYTPQLGPQCTDGAFDGRGRDTLRRMGKRIIVTLADGKREYDCDDPYAITDDETGTLTVRDGATVFGTFAKGDWTDVTVVPLT